MSEIILSLFKEHKVLSIEDLKEKLSDKKRIKNGVVAD